MKTYCRVRRGAAALAVILVVVAIANVAEAGWGVRRAGRYYSGCSCGAGHSSTNAGNINVPVGPSHEAASPTVYTTRYGSYDMTPAADTHYFYQPVEPRSMVGIDDPTTRTGE